MSNHLKTRIMFSLPYSEPFMSTETASALSRSDILRCHVSTVAQKGQTLSVESEVSREFVGSPTCLEREG